MIFCEYWVAGKSPNWDGKESARTPTSHYTQYTLLVASVLSPQALSQNAGYPMAGGRKIHSHLLLQAPYHGWWYPWKLPEDSKRSGSLDGDPSLCYLNWTTSVSWKFSVKKRCVFGGLTHSLGWWTRPRGNRWIKKKSGSLLVLFLYKTINHLDKPIDPSMVTWMLLGSGSDGSSSMAFHLKLVSVGRNAWYRKR